MWADILKKKSSKFYEDLFADTIKILQQKGPLTSLELFGFLTEKRKWANSIANPNALNQLLKRSPDIKMRRSSPNQPRSVKHIHLEGQ